MNRVVRLTAVFLFLASAAACEQKGGPVKVNKVEPAEGITGGGDQVIITGSGFQPGKTQVEVRFGRRRSEQVVISSSSKIAVVTPPGDKGAVDVTLAFDDGAFYKIEGGFKYLDPQTGQNVREAYFSGKAGEKK